ncbi:hypothetical protein [Fulvitalea axinellae]|uniref:hypothetical protein n=1 Tax=Fulvitalea axinellae TaxID=1182444 RepID=UPI0030CA52E7
MLYFITYTISLLFAGNPAVGFVPVNTDEVTIISQSTQTRLPNLKLWEIMNKIGVFPHHAFPSADKDRLQYNAIT